MYVLDPAIRKGTARHWALPDRIFFGNGACHILAGVFLERFPAGGFDAYWVKPAAGFSGNHVFVTDGEVAFDYHGYSALPRLLRHHDKVWSSRFHGWTAESLRVDFLLLNTFELNVRDMRGPDQYPGDVVQRAHRYLDRINHPRLRNKAQSLV